MTVMVMVIGQRKRLRWPAGIRSGAAFMQEESDGRRRGKACWKKVVASIVELMIIGPISSITVAFQLSRGVLSSASVCPIATKIQTDVQSHPARA